MHCLECKNEIPYVDNEHLARCCGLTLQEYALRHKLPLDILVPHSLLNRCDTPTDYHYSQKTISPTAKLTFAALTACGSIANDENFYIISGEIGRLDFLFGLQQTISEYGFQFKQEYIYNDKTHRVVALNRLKTPKHVLDTYRMDELEQLSNDDFLHFIAMTMALKAELYGGYLFLHYDDAQCADWICSRLTGELKIHFLQLDTVDGEGVLLRSETLADSRTLLHLIEEIISDIPCTYERFYAAMPRASLTKESVFDAAHFITDHAGSCANLHGGRYKLHVTISDTIDPYSGFVMDYGYLKAVIDKQVIKKLDHKSLNLSDVSLSWRSSTELLSMFIWRQLIVYLPNLSELLIYETDNSYCRFSGPSLEELQNGIECMPSLFANKQLGCSPIRRRVLQTSHPLRLNLVANENK